MNPLVKLNIIRFLRVTLKTLYIFPVKNNRILFSAYEGRAYTCNPKYICQAILENNDKEVIWCLNDSNLLPEELKDIKTVKFLSLKHLYYLLTSKVIVSNLGIEPFIPKRKNQVFINTWHGGGAYKRVSSNLNVFSKAEKKYTAKLRDFRKKDTDYFISSSNAFSKVMIEDMHVSPEIMVPIGMPRNDILINHDHSLISKFRMEIAKEYKLPLDALWVLYAPTFRGTYRNQSHIENQIINDRVIECFRNRFGKEVFILNRAHISKDGSHMESGMKCRDLTKYQDMQELLLACDVLITDYSSSVWDFALTLKPGFLFVPDLKEYEQTIGFYTPFKDWPFPYAENIDELCNLIETYEEIEGIRKCRRHIDLLGSFDKGHATTKAVDLIENIVNNK